MKNLPTLFFLLTTNLCLSQNLIPNGGFETFTTCPTSIDQINRAIGWVNPTGASPDYFNRCETTGFVGVPTSSFGVQQPHGGDAYAGICLLYNAPADFREYIQTRLISPLQAGKCYKLEMYVNLGEEYSKYTTDDFGAYLSVTPISDLQSMVNLTVSPQILNGYNNYPNTTTWKLSTGSYVALGGEEYITIGNFKPDNMTYKMPLSSAVAWEEIYMFVDDISLSICTDVGIPESGEMPAYSLYPSLFENELHVDVKDVSVAYLILYDKSGKSVLEKKFTSSCIIDTQELQPGLYFYQLRVGTNLVANGKVVRE